MNSWDKSWHWTFCCVVLSVFLLLQGYLPSCCRICLPSCLAVAGFIYLQFFLLQFLYLVVFARFVYLLVFLVLDLPTLLLHHFFYLVVVAGFIYLAERFIFSCYMVYLPCCCRVFRAGEVTEKEATWTFKLVHVSPDYRSYLFSASSQKEMLFWMKLFKQEMLRANGKLSR